MPFADYKDMEDCIKQNPDKDSPGGYCATIHKKVTGEWPAEERLEGLHYESKNRFKEAVKYYVGDKCPKCKKGTLEVVDMKGEDYLQCDSCGWTYHEESLKEQYIRTKDLKPGMKVMHKDWGRTSDPMEVVRVGGKIKLRTKGEKDTDPTAGGESDYGWFIAENFKEYDVWQKVNGKMLLLTVSGSGKKGTDQSGNAYEKIDGKWIKMERFNRIRIGENYRIPEDISGVTGGTWGKVIGFHKEFVKLNMGVYGRTILPKSSDIFLEKYNANKFCLGRNREKFSVMIKEGIDDEEIAKKLDIKKEDIRVWKQWLGIKEQENDDEVEEKESIRSRLEKLQESFKEYKITCIDCDEVSTADEWKKAGGFCPKCGSSKGVREESFKEVKVGDFVNIDVATTSGRERGRKKVRNVRPNGDIEVVAAGYDNFLVKKDEYELIENLKEPGVPKKDGTGPMGDTDECPLSKKEETRLEPEDLDKIELDNYAQDEYDMPWNELGPALKRKIMDKINKERKESYRTRLEKLSR